MSGTPYIQFYSDDWLSGTQDLSPEERGVLITIVALTASTGTPPKEDYDRLSRRFGCTKLKAKKIVKSLMELGKITVEDGRLVNIRAQKETEKSLKNSQKQSETAKKRWSLSDKKTNKNNDSFMPRHSRGICQPEPEPEPIEKEDKSSSSNGEDDFKFQEFWDGYPRTENQNPELVRMQWDLLDGDDKRAALDSLGSYTKKIDGGDVAWQPRVYLRDKIFKTMGTKRSVNLDAILSGIYKEDFTA